MRRVSFFFTVLALLASSCSDRPENVASDTKMVKVMADMEMAQAYLQNRGYRDHTIDSKERILEYVLQKNGLTKADFDSTLSWYGRHIDKYDDLYAKVDRELARRESKISGNEVVVLSNDLWPYSRHLVISSNSTTDNLSFSIPGTDLQKGDKITWKGRFNIPIDGSVVLGVKYTDGKSTYSALSALGKDLEISVQTDTARSVKDIFGNIRVKGNRSFVGIDSLTLFSVPFDSTEYYRVNSQKRFAGPKRKNIPVKELLDTLKTDSVGKVRKNG